MCGAHGSDDGVKPTGPRRHLEKEEHKAAATSSAGEVLATHGRNHLGVVGLALATVGRRERTTVGKTNRWWLGNEDDSKEAKARGEKGMQQQGML